MFSDNVWVSRLMKGAVVLIAAVFIMFIGGSVLGYMFHNVGDDEVGIKLRSNRIVEVVGPGIYSDPFTPFADMINVKVSGLQFCADDPEVLTRDQQRIGLKACGTVFRPGPEGSNTYITKWAAYKNFFLDDTTLVGEVNKEGVQVTKGLMTELAQQAMKVCVGDRNFSDAAVGEARDDLRRCIDTEMDGLVEPYGLRIDNVVVPNISIHETVQGLLDQITESRFQTDLLEQEKLRVDAEAARRLAEEQGQIKVEQGIIQERRRQEAVTAELERLSLEAQLQVIEAQKDNDLREADLDLAVTEAKLKVAEAQAEVDLAELFLLAELYENNPAYLEYLVAQEWARAWNSVDKVIVPQGTNPNTIVNPDNVDVIVPVTPEE